MTPATRTRGLAGSPDDQHDMRAHRTAQSRSESGRAGPSASTRDATALRRASASCNEPRLYVRSSQSTCG